MTDRWWLVFAVVMLAAGLAAAGGGVALLYRARPDTRARDPYGLAGRPGTPGVEFCCCYCAAPSGMDHPDWCPRAGVDVALDGPDGGHDVLSHVDAQQLAGELVWLFELMPEAIGLDQGDDLLARPPIVPGREGDH